MLQNKRGAAAFLPPLPLSPQPSALPPSTPTLLALPAQPRTRADALALYRAKRARRAAFPPPILYARRKANADARPRIGGRFVNAEVAARLRAETAAAAAGNVAA